MSLFNLLTQLSAGPFPLIRDSIFSHCLGPLYQNVITLSSLFLLYLLFFVSLVRLIHCILLPLTAYQPVLWISLFNCDTISVALFRRIDRSSLLLTPHSYQPTHLSSSGSDTGWSVSSANSLALSGLTLCPSSDPSHVDVPLLHVSVSS